MMKDKPKSKRKSRTRTEKAWGAFDSDGLLFKDEVRGSTEAAIYKVRAGAYDNAKWPDVIITRRVTISWTE